MGWAWAQVFEPCMPTRIWIHVKFEMLLVIVSEEKNNSEWEFVRIYILQIDKLTHLTQNNNITKILKLAAK